jgi:hypothetical protein
MPGGQTPWNQPKNGLVSEFPSLREYGDSSPAFAGDIPSLWDDLGQILPEGEILSRRN